MIQDIKEEQAYKIHETKKYIYYICRGNSVHPYEIIYNKERKSFSCSCKNVRFVDCKHIKLVKILENKNKEVNNNGKSII